ncbi:MAG: molybdopterin converting factor subunit 1 [Duodenibacillus sp.]|nr:molybdopterin converting factor subunit 1 [Duodenibacillus sp.]
MQINMLYFASVRELLDAGSETLEVPDGVATLGGLLAWLKAESPRHAAMIEQLPRLRGAVNQEMAGPGAPVKAGDEVALFPPVTGG